MSFEGLAIFANMLIIGGVGGYFIGWFLKKVIKIVLIGFAVLVFSLASLAVFGTINVNYEGIATGIANSLNPQQLAMILGAMASYLPLMASFAVGFLLGVGRK